MVPVKSSLTAANYKIMLTILLSAFLFGCSNVDSKRLSSSESSETTKKVTPAKSTKQPTRPTATSQKSTASKKSTAVKLYTESGKASYYANKFQGRSTASGEAFDQSKKTAAHKKLAFGTRVKVTNVKNGKSVVVRVNDRGPFVKGRIIDLSLSAFKTIGNTDSGVVSVKIEVMN